MNIKQLKKIVAELPETFNTFIVVIPAVEQAGYNEVHSVAIVKDEHSFGGPYVLAIE